jgi:hypothetical protein
MAPELWNAVTGKIAPAGYRVVNGRTEIAMALGAYDSIFVVFRHSTHKTAQEISTPAATPLMTLAGPWTVAFQPDRGAPASITQDSLSSWSENPDSSVRYFSGSAVYSQSFILPPNAKGPGAHMALDLGDLRDVAEVSLNGQPLGILWNPPFVLDIGGALQSGENRLQVKVANLWVNRLIGDAQPEAKTKYTFTTIPTYEPDAPLRPSGLLGPVQILRTSP